MGLFNWLLGGKSAPASPVAPVEDQKAVDFSADMWAAINGGWGIPTKSGTDISVSTALQVPAFFRGVMVIADGIAQLPVSLYRTLPSGKGSEPAVDHPLYDLLLHQASELQDAFQFYTTILMHAAATGNSVSYKVVVNGETRELIPVRPENTEVDILSPLMRKTFRLTFENGFSATVGSSEVFHLAGPGWRCFKGLDPSLIGREALGLARATEESQARLHSNGVRPSGMFSPAANGRVLTKEQVEQLRAQINETYAGLQNAMKVIVASGAMDYKQFTMTGVDAQHLECCAPGTLFSMADGTRRLVEELRVGDRVIAWDEESRSFVASNVAFVGAPPRKPLVRVVTMRGRVLTTTHDHPYLTIEALRTPGGRPTANERWIKAEDIKAGSYVRTGVIPAQFQFETSQVLDESAAWFLGLMVGDGYIRNGGCSLSATDPSVIDRARQFVESLGGSLVQSVSRPCDLVINSGGTNTEIGKVRMLFREAGLEGCGAADKRVPDIVFRGGRAAWAAFLSGYLDADGTVSRGDGRNKLVSWSSINQALLDDCQHLLAMLGIQSAIYLADPGGLRDVLGQECDAKPVYALCVYGVDQLRALSGVLRPAHLQKATRLSMFEDLPPSKYRQENFEYDRIKSVELLPAGDTVGVEIEGTHTHVTNGMVTHNTRKHQIEEICRVLGVFPIMVGHAGDQSPTFASAEAFFDAHVRYTLQRWIAALKAAINSQLLTKDERREGYFVRIDTSELTRGSLEARTRYYQAALGSNNNPGWLDPNEVREDDGWNPREGLDNVMSPTTTMAPAGDQPPPSDSPPADTPPAGDSQKAFQEEEELSDEQSKED